jgi:beta-galactosidase
VLLCSLFFVLSTAITGAAINSSPSVLKLENHWQVQPAQSSTVMPATDQWADLKQGDWRHIRFETSSDKHAWMMIPRVQVHCLWYRTTFELPQNWVAGRLIADFHRIEGDAIIFLNGVRSGELLRPGGNFELTDQMRAGKNELLVYVTRNYTDISHQFEQDKLRYFARHVRSQIPMGRSRFSGGAGMTKSETTWRIIV